MVPLKWIGFRSSPTQEKYDVIAIVYGKKGPQSMMLLEILSKMIKRKKIRQNQFYIATVK